MVDKLLDNPNERPLGNSGMWGGRGGSSDIVESTKWAKDIFLDIKDALQKRGDPFASYFNSFDGKMNIVEVRLKLNNLGVRVNEKVSQLLNQLCDDLQPNLVDLRNFEKAYNFHKDVVNAGNINAFSPYDNYVEIRQAL
jgi:hypothetical protein